MRLELAVFMALELTIVMADADGRPVRLAISH
jgi:hypothetical protein